MAAVSSWAELDAYSSAVNEMPSVSRLLDRWNGSPRTDRLALLTNQYGQINDTGRAGSFAGLSVVPGETVFVDGQRGSWLHSLEPGVRRLVPLIIEAFGCITYSSCGGHEFSERADLRPAFREVAILPRSPLEADRLAAELSSVFDMEALVHSSVSVSVLRETLLSLEDKTAWRALSLCLRPVDHNWRPYFQAVDSVTRSAEQLLLDRLVTRNHDCLNAQL